ncbi:hypothetical protein WISP_22581 [Willisornis vidua]|uniref:Uncharacterized protein n=1 Tax=Willisornis vidua TaxID=1566151 RepID=A0ABQ9DMT2_9PASS|nr:hypothetical protein WISP_22581 [Willisornis vidua]
MLMRTQLHRAGHVSRMEDHPLSKIVLYGEPATSCHKRGVLKKDSLKQHLSLGHIDCHRWSTLASNRDSWRHTIHHTAASFENARRVSLEEKRQHIRIVPHQYRLRRCSAVPFVIRLAYPASAFLATITLAASMGSALLKSSFVKPHHNDDISFIIKYIQTHSF